MLVDPWRSSYWMLLVRKIYINELFVSNNHNITQYNINNIISHNIISIKTRVFDSYIDIQM